MVTPEWMDDPRLGLTSHAKETLAVVLERQHERLAELNDQVAKAEARAKGAEREIAAWVQGHKDDRAADLEFIGQLRAAGVRHYSKNGLTVDLDPPEPPPSTASGEAKPPSDPDADLYGRHMRR